MLGHVIGTGGVNHFVCVDGTAKIISDSMEWRPMHLSHATLQCCVGDGLGIRRLFVPKWYGSPWRTMLENLGG